MIRNTIHEIEESVRRAGSVSDETKAELLRLLSTLEAEVSELSRTNADQAQSIAGFAALSTHEATRPAKNPSLVQVSLKGLQLSVHGFEGSHPRLVQTVNAVCTALSNVGI
jgi:hypothetical protein